MHNLMIKKWGPSHPEPEMDWEPPPHSDLALLTLATLGNMIQILPIPLMLCPGMIESRDSQQVWNETSLFQYCLSHF
jgi:hypothetical protein